MTDKLTHDIEVIKETLIEMTGANEAAIDAMMLAFKDVYDALQANRPNKAHRLIEGITDPAMETLKAELLEILK